ncbi:mRNA-decapping enzyme [Plectosphaerella plurivora]|uniref:mRNA-decapping enzyme n=1 Tax=Plectosphaerella plurivora TaxID=936078 RepID=A0A9P8VBU3_9PEZI|nr:mRNA-decapping enzyme [Plectosphaerella plurivora]
MEMAGNKMHLEDWLDDLCVRFIINLPEEDLSSIARICFQIEEAQWFYEDFIRPLDPTLPSMTLRSFSLRIFQHCPLLAPFSVENHTRAFEEFLQYKTRVPVRGAILLNEAMDSTILVKGWKKGANWSFPRGKINKDEDDLECAIREVYEETGYDLHAAGLVPKDREVKHIEITMREQQMRLYVFRNVPMETHFAPRTRKEISKIQWYRLSELPAFRRKGANANDQNDAAVAANANKFYMVAPFLVPLKKWVVQQKKKEARMAGAHASSQIVIEEPPTEDDAWAQNYENTSATRKPNQPPTDNVPALDTLEGATEALQLLLKGQQAGVATSTAEVPSDKGASLLAMLKASSQSSSSGPAVQRIQQQSTVSATQHYQQYEQQHDFPHQAPFPPMHGANPQQWHRQVEPPSLQAYSQSPSIPQGHPQAPLRHPQPLPPQVQINRGGFLASPQPPPMGYNPEPPTFGPRGAAPMVHHGPNQTSNLSSQSMSLLQAFTSGSGPSPVHPAAATATPPTIPGGAQRLVADASNPNMPVPMAGPPTIAGPPRPNQATTQQRATLLGMFKKADVASVPEGEQPQQSAGETLLKQMLARAPSAHAAEPSGLQPGQPGLALMSRLQQPVRDSGLSGEAGTVPNLGQAGSPAPNYADLGRAGNVAQNAPHRFTPVNQSPMATYASHERPTSLTSPPATSSLPTPAILQGKNSMSHEQRHKLLSLFGKPQVPKHEGLVPDEQGKGKEVALPAASPVPSSSGAAPLHLSESRRGSQTPISPADRSFLLNYLASATSKAQ